MHADVYKVFEEICKSEAIKGPLLEVGAVAQSDSLMQMGCLGHIKERIGINPAEAASGDGWEIIKGTAHDMSCFSNDYFGALLCNATLEHDPGFWKSLSEMRRVTARGGLIVIGVPGFSGMGPDSFCGNKSVLKNLLRLAARITRADMLLAGTVTLGEHNFPGDYYRFTEQAVREVFMEGLNDIRVRRVMHPPRIIGWGRKP